MQPQNCTGGGRFDESVCCAVVDCVSTTSDVCDVEQGRSSKGSDVVAQEAVVARRLPSSATQRPKLRERDQTAKPSGRVLGNKERDRDRVILIFETSE